MCFFPTTLDWECWPWAWECERMRVWECDESDSVHFCSSAWRRKDWRLTCPPLFFQPSHPSSHPCLCGKNSISNWHACGLMEFRHYHSPSKANRLQKAIGCYVIGCKEDKIAVNQIFLSDQKLLLALLAFQKIRKRTHLTATKGVRWNMNNHT